jgi:hypothetical protein
VCFVHLLSAYNYISCLLGAKRSRLDSARVVSNVFPDDWIGYIILNS